MNSRQKTSYRLDIQGLRAIAISTVVLAHANVPGFSGGFIGVDVFFVLSGFLITGLLVQERLDTGAIRYGKFLARRLRRLLPALLTMLVTVLLLAYLLLSSYEARMQTGSFVYSATWTSNLYFTFAQFDYFAALKAKDVFLHTWSLGIEEQFYIVWPWLVVLSFAIPARNAGRTRRLTPLIALVAIVFVISLCLCLYWAQTNHLMSFYMMPSRGWQFALGASVFVYSHRYQLESANRSAFLYSYTTRQLAGATGLLLILGSAVLLNSSLTYPGYFALFPSVGAALLLLAGTQGRPAVTSKILASRFFVWIGDRSYSLYLWHWPVLLLGGTFGLSDNYFGTVALIAGSILLAALSYHLIERPFWKGRFSMTSPRLVVVASTLAMVAMVGASHWLVADVFTGSARSGYRAVSNRAAEAPAVFTAGSECDSWFSSSQVVPCSSGDGPSEHTAVLIGDSIGAQWASILPEIYAAPDWQILVLTKSACALVDVEYYYEPAGGLYDVCTSWRNASIEYLAELEPDIVFVGSSSDYDFSKAQWIKGSERVIEKLASAARHVVVLPGTPALSFHGPSCIKEPYRFTLRLRSSESICEEAITSTVSDDVAEYLAKVASGIANADVLRLNDLVCPGQRCAARSEDGVTVFSDDRHLTPSFVVAQAPAVLSRLNSIEAGPSFLEQASLSVTPD